MSIKAKLIILLVLMCLVVGLIAGVMIRDFLKFNHQVQIADATLDELYALAKVRSSITRQMKEVMDYFVAFNEQDRGKFKEFGTQAKRSLAEWTGALQAQVRLGVQGKEDDLKRARDLKSEYNDGLNLVMNAFRLADEGQTEEAYKLMEGEADTWMDDVLFKQIDEDVAYEIEKVDEAYQRVLMRLGSLSWAAEKSRKQIEIAEASIDYFLVVDRTQSGIARQMKEAMDYCISFEDKDKEQFERSRIEAIGAFNEWIKALQVQIALGVEGKEEDLERARNVNNRYNDALEMIISAFKLEKEGKGKAYAIIEEKIEPLLNNVLPFTIEDSQREIANAHNRLLDFTVTAGVQTIIVLGIFSLLIVSISVALIKGMITSLSRLRRGTEIIGTGILSHRIDLKAKDEFGRLASSFDRMAEALQRSNAELEQRVKERTAQLASANKELEAFSYSVSHNLRAPLRSINGFSQMLFEDYLDKLDERGKDYLQRVRVGSQRMAQLIDDVLSLLRITRSEIHRERVDLSILAKKVASELQKTQPERQVKFVIQEGLVADGDAQLLREALEKLLCNAWKFTRNHPSAIIEFGTTQHDGRSAYFVRDNGVGFDMAYADKLFGAFQRLHTRTEFEGTGIGLATVQRIIHRHGGRVWAESSVGQGATFYFTLAVSPQPSALS